MTRAERKPWMDDVDPVVIDAVRARWRRGMPDADLQRLATALTVPHDACGAAEGVECRNLRDGGEVRFGFHLDRGRDAGVTWPPTTATELADPAPPKPRRADGWPQVPPPDSDEEDDQGWRRG